MKNPGIALLSGLALLGLGAWTPAAAAPGDFKTIVQVTAGLPNAIGVVNAGDGSGRLFVVQQTGQIRIWTGSQLLSTPFLDTTGISSACDPTNGCGERGLLGLAFHPSYKTNGLFYVYYTRQSDGAIQIARYHVSANPNVADAASALVLITIPHPTFANHNGGQIVFGPDGYLYAGTGDGGSGGDPNGNGQNINALLGKILRIDVNGDDFPSDTSRNYAIPPTNPFAAAAPGAGAHEIWAYGVRNPWRFSFDRANGDLYIGDVGQDSWEEVDYQAAGAPDAAGRNYGWNCREGFHPFSSSTSCNSITAVDPVLEYPHNPECSITGGFVFRGLPAHSLTGKYFYGDFCSGRIWTASHSGSTWMTAQLFDTSFKITSFGQGETGRLYFTSPGELQWLAPYTFADVTPTYFAWPFVEAIYTRAITSGCGGDNYCPESTITRAEMAVFLLIAEHGPGYTPPPATGTVFNDVPAGSFAAAFIEQLAHEGVTTGCGGGNYCPGSPTTRDQMAVFLLLAKEGSSYAPPACSTPTFSDVPCSSSFAPWVDELARRGVTGGCGGGNYCPSSSVTRGQMAVFLATTFGLPTP
jgi:Glucose / Sorbosone dehydrogenase/S-layer homology domain